MPKLVRAILFLICSGGFLVQCNRTEESLMPNEAARNYTAQAEESYENVVAALGPPDVLERFRMRRELQEFRIELRNFFSDDELDDNAPMIREATWKISADENYTIWFVERDGAVTVLDQLRWSPDTEF